MAQDLQRVTLLQFLRCLPDTAWLRSSILWADDLSAIWPETAPEPFDEREQQSAEEIASLRSARQFQPSFLFDIDPRTIRAALRGTRQQAVPGPAWEDGAPAVGSAHAPSQARGELRRYKTDGERRRYKEDDGIPAQFLYPGKLSYGLYAEFLRHEQVRPTADRRGVVVSNAESLERLLAAGASVLHQSSGGRLMPDVSEPAQARRIAAPTAPSKGSDAVLLALRSAAAPNLRTDFRRFIDFRLDGKNERARRDYISRLVDLWTLCSDGGPEHAEDQVFARAAADLRKAGDSYFKRLGPTALVSGGLGSFAAVIPLAVAHPPALIVAATAALGTSVLPLTVRSGATKYVRSANRSGLLASMTGL